MKKKRYTEYLITLAIILTGCVHEYPTRTEEGMEGVDPTLVQVNVEVMLDLALLPLTKTTDGYCRRVIIEALREGQAETRQVIMTEDDKIDDGQLTLPVRMNLHAVEYTLVVWSDYVKADNTSDLYYNTENLHSVNCTDPYTGSTHRRDCLYGTASLDLRPYREKWNVNVQVPMVLIRPVAQYRIITTDIEPFIRRIKSRNNRQDMTVTFTYDFFVPTGFNAVEGVTTNSMTGITFTTPLVLPGDGMTECELGHDFVFSNAAESFVVLNIEVRNAEGQIVSRNNGLKVPYKQGHQTTLRSNLLTSETEGGMNINPDFDGEVEIDLDGIIE